MVNLRKSKSGPSTCPGQPAARGFRGRLGSWTGGAALLAAGTLAGSYLLAVRRPADSAQPPTARVSRGEIAAVLSADGELESAGNTEVRCQVAGGSTILWLVPEGATVHRGDELARLDSAAIEDQILKHSIAVERARAAKITSDREQAAARVAVEEYLAGKFGQQHDELALAVVTAENNLHQTEHVLRNSRKLARCGFLAPVQLEADVFRLERARLALDLARQNLHVLDTYTRPRVVRALTARHEAAEAKHRAAAETLELEAVRLARWQTRLAQCTIRAPQDGLVLYANDQARSRSGLERPPIETGAFVREHQPILRLPNLKRMQVRCLVHEASVERVRPGIPARVEVLGDTFHGTVRSVANQPEPPRHGRQHLRYFAVTVSIDEPARRLRPNGTANVELLLTHRSNVLTVPREALVQDGSECFAWVQADDALVRRRIRLGSVDDRLAEVGGSLADGEQVVLHPRDYVPEAARSDRWGPAGRRGLGNPPRLNQESGAGK